MKKIVLRFISYFVMWYGLLALPILYRFFFPAPAVAHSSCLFSCFSDKDILTFLNPYIAFALSCFTILFVYIFEGTVSALKASANSEAKPKLHSVFVVSVLLVLIYLVLRNPFLSQIIDNKKIQSMLEIILAVSNFGIAVMYDKYNIKVRGQVIGSILISVILLFFAMANGSAY